DLYYRLNVVELYVPPLRERPEAIAGLSEYFLARFNTEYGRQLVLSPETLMLMATYTWPGNVRELENFIRRLVVIGDSQRGHQELLGRIQKASAPAPSAAQPVQPMASVSPVSPMDGAVAGLFDLKTIARRAAREAERRALAEVLERVRWNRTAAARILKVSYKTLLSKLAECELVPPK